VFSCGAANILAREKAAQLGADGFVSKSADPNEILVKIKEIFK
jgi:DNA-binding NarL/FixJ family response regulator